MPARWDWDRKFNFEFGLLFAPFNVPFGLIRSRLTT
jgi:hypothetical protein